MERNSPLGKALLLLLFPVDTNIYKYLSPSLEIVRELQTHFLSQEMKKNDTADFH